MAFQTGVLQLNHFLLTALDPDLVAEDLPSVKEVWSIDYIS